MYKGEIMKKFISILISLFFMMPCSWAAIQGPSAKSLFFKLISSEITLQGSDEQISFILTDIQCFFGSYPGTSTHVRCLFRPNTTDSSRLIEVSEDKAQDLLHAITQFPSHKRDPKQYEITYTLPSLECTLGRNSAKCYGPGEEKDLPNQSPSKSLED